MAQRDRRIVPRVPRASRLSAAERADLIARYRNGATKKDLATQFRVPLSTIQYHTQNVVRPAMAAALGQALDRELARHAPAYGQPAPPLTAAQAALLRRRWRDGATVEALQTAFGVSPEIVERLVENVARSSRGQQRERARNAAQERTAQGLPALHPGASAVWITLHRRGGCELRISRELFRQLGAPERLDVTRFGTRLMLRAGSSYSVRNGGIRETPRMTLGAAPCGALRLTTDGQFPARFVRQPTPHITVQVHTRSDGSVDDMERSISVHEL